MTKTNKATKTASANAKAAAKAQPVTAAEAKAIFPGKTTRRDIDAATAADLRKIAAETGAPRAMASEAQLARGIRGGQAPHSAKALSDAAAKRNTAKTANKADAVVAKGKAKADAKADKPARQSWTENRKYKATFKASEIVAREGTWRRAMLECVVANTTTDAANACCAKNREYGQSHKIDWRWLAKEGYISI
jgi:hypothetical protein